MSGPELRSPSSGQSLDDVESQLRDVRPRYLAALGHEQRWALAALAALGIGFALTYLLRHTAGWPVLFGLTILAMFFCLFRMFLALNRGYSVLRERDYLKQEQVRLRRQQQPVPGRPSRLARILICLPLLAVTGSIAYLRGGPWAALAVVLAVAVLTPFLVIWSERDYKRYQGLTWSRVQQLEEAQRARRSGPRPWVIAAVAWALLAFFLPLPVTALVHGRPMLVGAITFFTWLVGLVGAVFLVCIAIAHRHRRAKTAPG